jgi:hypothetical protein
MIETPPKQQGAKDSQTGNNENVVVWNRVLGVSLVLGLVQV